MRVRSISRPLSRKDLVEAVPAAAPPNSNGLEEPSVGAAAAESSSDAARVVARVRRLMLISSALTLAAILVVLGLAGYRLFRSGQSHETDVALTLPKGTKILQTAVAEDRIIVTLDADGAIEIRTYDLHTLKPVGRISFGFAP
jgi:multidrug efflux pump subunit AcrB